jgi:hypothetical protein
MVTLKCVQDDCISKDIEFNFLGNPELAECGGCKEILIATNHRDDPEQSTDLTDFAIN